MSDLKFSKSHGNIYRGKTDLCTIWNVPNLKVIFPVENFTISSKQIKMFCPFTVVILQTWEGHADSALFSPVSLPAN